MWSVKVICLQHHNMIPHIYANLLMAKQPLIPPPLRASYACIFLVACFTELQFFLYLQRYAQSSQGQKSSKYDQHYLLHLERSTFPWLLFYHLLQGLLCDTMHTYQSQTWVCLDDVSDQRSSPSPTSDIKNWSYHIKAIVINSSTFTKPLYIDLCTRDQTSWRTPQKQYLALNSTW